KEQQWKPGQSGNPGGRPKKKPITERYAANLEETVPEAHRISLKLRKGATWADAMTMALLLLAARGNIQAAKEITDRVEGKVAQQAEVTNLDDKPLPILPIEMDDQAIFKRISAVIGVGLPMEYRVEPPDDEAPVDVVARKE